MYSDAGDEASESRGLVEKQLLSVGEFADAIGVGETMAKRLLQEGSVLSVRVGDRRLVPAAAVKDYVDQLVAKAQAMHANREPIAVKRRSGETEAAGSMLLLEECGVHLIDADSE